MTDKAYKYQLIVPLLGSKIYQRKNFDDAVKNCYLELKGFYKDFSNTTKFVVLNIDTNEVYNFEIIKRSTGNDYQDVNKNLDVNNINNKEKDMYDMSYLNTKLRELESKMAIMENKINNIDNNNGGILNKTKNLDSVGDINNDNREIIKSEQIHEK